MIVKRKRKKDAMNTLRAELYEYVHKNLKGALSKRKIIAFQTAQGWKKETVKEVIAEVQKERASQKTGEKGKKAELPKKHVEEKTESLFPEKDRTYLEKYSVQTTNFPVNIGIFKTPRAYTPVYELKIKQISKETEIVLERIREELISQVSLGALEITEANSTAKIKKKFEKAILNLIDKYFIDLDIVTRSYLGSFLIQKALGLGMIEFLLQDANLEEVVVNNSKEPIWVYHKKYGWLQQQ